MANEDKSEEERKEEVAGLHKLIEEEIFLELTQSEYEKLFKLFNEYTQMYELVSDSGLCFLNRRVNLLSLKKRLLPLFIAFDIYEGLVTIIHHTVRGQYESYYRG